MKTKIALVTGGMGGIGTAICHHLIDQCAMVITTYNRGGDHQAANLWRKQQLEKGYNITMRYVDVADFTSCKKMVQDIENEFDDFFMDEDGEIEIGDMI